MTLGLLTVDVGKRYRITGKEALTFDVSSGSASISVMCGGRLAIETDVVLNDKVQMVAASTSSTVNISGDISGSGGLEKTGDGFLTL